jgi:hypothetical protein
MRAHDCVSHTHTHTHTPTYKITTIFYHEVISKVFLIYELVFIRE